MSALSSAAAARNTVPLVYQSFNWNFGVYMAATLGSETTAAASVPPAMYAATPLPSAVLRLPHGRLFQPLAAVRPARFPRRRRIFSVNWFRKDANGKFICPATAITWRPQMDPSSACRESRGGRVAARLDARRYQDMDWDGWI